MTSVHGGSSGKAGPRTLIWDFDGTLATRRGGWSGAIVECLAAENGACTVMPETIREHIRTGFPWHSWERHHPELAETEAWWANLLPVFTEAMCKVGVPRGQAEALAPRVRERYLHEPSWMVFEDAVPTLSHLSKRGWQHVIFSNHVPELEAIVAWLGLRPHIARIFNSAQIGYEKPHPAAFAHVLTAINQPRQVWMIGDNYKADIQGAREADIPAVLVRKDHPESDRFCVSLDGVIDILNER